MLKHLAESESLPVFAHLIHGENLDVCRIGIGCGFTFVMHDGSALPLAENIARTAEGADVAGYLVSVQRQRWDLLAAITAAAPFVPLVLLGGSLIAAALCSDLARSNICQFNIGTELRLVFGQALREAPARCNPVRPYRTAV